MCKSLGTVAEVGGPGRRTTRNRSSEGPDKGWAWVVALACFAINFIMAGLARSAGVLYVALIDVYGATREEATTPFSIRVCVRNLTGPLVGILGQRYGIRSITAIGGLVAAVGGALCYLSPNVFWITVFWGVIHGIGFGLSTVIHMMSINHYFDKYRATALGMGYSGDCFGTFVLPIIIEALIDNYDVRGSFLIIGGIVLHVIPLAMLLKPPPWKVDATRNKVHVSKQTSFVITAVSKVTEENNVYGLEAVVNEGFVITEKGFADAPLEGENDAEHPDPDPKKTTESSNHIFKSSEDINRVNQCIDEKDCVKEIELSLEDAVELGDLQEAFAIKHILNSEESEHRIRTGSACVMDGYLPPAEIAECTCQVKADATNLTNLASVTQVIVGNRSQITSLAATLNESIMENGTSTRIRASSETNRKAGTDCTNLERSKSLSKKCDEKFPSIFSVKNQLNLSERKTGMRQDSDIMPCIRISNEIAEDKSELKKILEELPPTFNKYEQQGMQTCSGHSDGTKSVFRTALRANAKPIFILISITMATYVTLFVSVMTVIIDFGIDKDVSAENGKYLVIAFSAADLIGRVGFGVVIDKRWIPMQHYAAMTVALMGLIVTILPFGRGFLALSIGMSLFGFIQGGCAIMYPILIDKYMEKDEESIGMGCLNFYGGLLCLAVAPMIGFFRDTYGSYDGMFYIVGLITLASGLTWLLEPFILKCRSKQLGNRNANLELVYGHSDKK